MKRNRIWPYLGIGAITALILALVLVALPAGAATSGSVQGVQGDLSVLSDTEDPADSEAITWVSPDGDMNSFVIQLEDSDLDVATTVTQDETRVCAANGSLTVVTRDPAGDRVPVLDRNGDGRLTFTDVTLDGAADTASILTVNGPDGIITIGCGATPTSNDMTLTYDTSSVDTTFTGTTVVRETPADPTSAITSITGGADRVTVTSGADRTGITARLVETRRDSGVFELKINVCKTEADDCSQTGRMHNSGTETTGDGTGDPIFYVPSDTSRGSRVYANGGADTDAVAAGIQPANYVLQEMPLTSSTAPSDIEAKIQIFVPDPRSTTGDPRDDILTGDHPDSPEKYLSIDKVDTITGEVTITTQRAIPVAANAATINAAHPTNTTIITGVTDAFEGFAQGDVIEIRIGNDSTGELYSVAKKTSGDVIEIDRGLEDAILLRDVNDSGSGATVVDKGVSFTMSYRTSADDDGDAMIQVNPAGDTITIVYDDPDDARERTTIKVETVAPAIDELSDSSNGAGGDATPTFFAEVMDQGSGITTNTKDGDSIKFIFMLMDPNGAELAGPAEVERDKLRDEDEITGGFRVEAEFGSGDITTNAKEYEIHWWVQARDIAGNLGVSDNPAKKDTTGNKPSPCDPSAFTINNSSVTTGGCDPFTVRVDTLDPGVDMAITGNWWDPGADRGKELQKGAAAKLDRVMVIFNEPMDGDSFDAADFRVAGSRPTDVDWYDADPQEGAADQGELCIRCAAFLTLSSPLDPNDTPRVQVVGVVSDTASNTLDEANIAAADDGISAKLAVTVTGTHMAEGGRPVTDETVTVTVTSDETLRSRPELDIRRVVRKDRSADFETSSSAVVTDFGIAPASGTRTWIAEVAIPGEGLYNVYVTGIGQGDGVMAEAGVAPGNFDTKSVDSTAVMLIEVDTGIEQPKFIPDKMSEDPDVLVRIDFESEANEYGLMEENAKAAVVAGDDDVRAADADADPPVTAIKKGDTLSPAVDATDAVDFDTYGTVSLVSVTFDGPGYDEQDVTDNFFTRNGVVFSWRPGDLALGEYSITVTAMDEAGNEVDLAPATFKIVAPTPYSLPIDPGVNLISLPGDPVDMDINEVIPTDGTIDLVTTYDPEAALGPWLVAVWNADTGLFEGTLTTIDSMHGYWVRASSPISLSASLQRQAQAGVTPPTIAVSAGWNLVPVVDLGRSAEGTEISAAAYFAGVEWSLAYTYDATEAKWVRIPNIPPPAEGEKDPEGLVRNVEVGKGYWVWAIESGTIVP